MSSRSSPTWLRQDAVLAIHDEQLSQHGGALGIRDIGLLESALARPQNAAAYADQEPDIPTLGALYALGVIQGHPFVDGNKRVGFVLLELFFDLNGYELIATDSECYATILGVTGGVMTEESFFEWVRKHAALRNRANKDNSP